MSLVEGSMTEHMSNSSTRQSALVEVMTAGIRTLAVHTDAHLDLGAAEQRTLHLASLAMLGRFERLGGRMGDRGFGLVVGEKMWLMVEDQHWVEGRRSLVGLSMVFRVLKSVVVQMMVHLHWLDAGVRMGCLDLRQRLPSALCLLCHLLVAGSSRGA